MRQTVRGVELAALRGGGRVICETTWLGGAPPGTHPLTRCTEPATHTLVRSGSWALYLCASCAPGVAERYRDLGDVVPGLWDRVST